MTHHHHSNLKQPGYKDVVVKTDIAATMRDGCKLLADVYRPNTKEDLPVLLMRTPYDKRTAQSCVYLDPTWYARYGYMVVVQDCRGRYASDGNWTPFLNETDDGFDTIEWASSLPGANGKLGMYGFSYAGAVQLLAASANPKNLVAIAPALTGSDFFNGWTYEGGALSQAFVQSWAISLAQNTAMKQGDFDSAKELGQLLGQVQGFFFASPLSSVPDLLSKFAPYYSEWLKHDCYDEYWKKIAVRERYDNINVPALHIGGWYDIFIAGTIKNFIELNKRKKQKSGADRAEQKLLVGPWYHLPWQSQMGCCDFGTEAVNVVNAAQLSWFNRHLKGLEQESKQQDVSVFLMNANKWQPLEDWPPHTVYPTNFYLHSNGRANTKDGDGALSRKLPADEAWDSFIYDPSFPVFSLGGRSCCFDLVAPMGPRDQRPNQSRNDVLVYTTEAFHSDTTLMGQITLKLFAASTAYDTDFTVTVSEVHQCGKAVNLANGILRASRRESLIHPRKIEPNAVNEYNIKVGWTAALIKKGNRVRVELSSSNFPHYNINPNNGGSANKADIQDRIPARQTIFHDSRYPSHLVLPISTAHDF